MKPSNTHRFLLVASGLIAGWIGAQLLIAPIPFHANNGIELGTQASLLSEVRAPGGALLALGILMIPGAFAASFTLTSTSIAAAVYLAYGASRLLSIALDGVPSSGLVAATVIEIVFGVACALFLLRATSTTRSHRRAIEGPNPLL